MRRSRTIREHRHKLLRNRAVSNSERQKNTQDNLLKAKRNRGGISRDRISAISAIRRKTKQRKVVAAITKIDSPMSKPLDMHNFIPYDEYTYQSRPVNVLHLIESIGLGGAQTMMLELVNGLNTYYEPHINNMVVNLVSRIKNKMSNRTLYNSYGVIPEKVDYTGLKGYCNKNDIDIVVHHRISQSKCIKRHIPKNAKYILINHTWNSLGKMSKFPLCDLCVSVCKFLDRKTQWPEFIHKTRHIIILNGVENKYIDDLEAVPLSGKFKTGRCHRLISGKFSLDSIRWMDRKVTKMIPGFKHYIVGNSSIAKAAAADTKCVKYLGGVLDRNKKMSIIKAFDAYFYETFQNEGASVSVLESLACGVPVLCKPLGGNPELVINNVNGFIVGDRSEFAMRMRMMASNQEGYKKMCRLTREDFDRRLHVRHTACKYMQIFEHLINGH